MNATPIPCRPPALGLGRRAALSSGEPRDARAAGRLEPGALPRVSPLLLRWFTYYCRRYLRRHFHSLRVSRAGLPPAASDWPLVIYANHASWWDPIVGLVIKHAYFPGRTLYAPIDAAMLERYRLFGRLGFFGVEQHHGRGAVRFLRTSQSVLGAPDSLLALTPQGRFADPRERPVRFAAGLGHLAARVERALFVPMATEFVFWEERLPEILVRFGTPLEIQSGEGCRRAPAEWTDLLEQGMESAQDTLAIEAQRRDPADFDSLLRGGAGQGGIYDLWRALKAACRGQTFAREHGRK